MRKMPIYITPPKMPAYRHALRAALRYAAREALLRAALPDAITLLPAADAAIAVTLSYATMREIGRRGARKSCKS